MEQTVFHLHNGETALFGYGSLLSVASLEQTLQRKYDGPFLVCGLRGWRRSWDVAMPNRVFYTQIGADRSYPEHILYLNVRPVPESLLNGVLFVVNEKELRAMDQREWIYSRQPITHDLEGVRITGSDGYVYVARPDYLMTNVESPRKAAVRATYLEILETGLRELGQSFRQRYEASTDPVPQHLVIHDLRDPQAANPFTPGATKG